MTESLQTAEQTRDDLRRKLDDTRKVLAALDDARRAIAFEAHSKGGDAKASLDKMGKQRIGLLDSIETLECALLEASRKIEAASAEVAMAEHVKKAERALEIAAGLIERAKKIDAALAAIVSESNALESDFRELNHSLGCTSPNEHQFASLGVRALKAAMMFSPLKIEHLAPNERHTFSELAHGWSATIERWSSPWLVKKSEAA